MKSDDDSFVLQARTERVQGADETLGQATFFSAIVAMAENSDIIHVGVSNNYQGK